MNPLLLTDFYKVGHLFQYPKGTEYVYSNLTPRSNKHFPQADKMVPSINIPQRGSSLVSRVAQSVMRPFK